MANQELALQSMKAPSYLAKRDAAELAEFNKSAATGTIGGVSVPRISLKGSRFRLVKGGEEIAVLQESHLDLVFLRASTVLTKTFYEKAWVPGQEPESPDCYSEDGVRPAADVKKKQHANCAECPHNQWGSKINPLTGADGKACADSKRVSVVPPSMPDGEAFQLAIPAASMKDFGSYMNKLNSLAPPAPYNAVVTKVSFDTEATYPKLLFTAVRYLTEEEYAVINARYDNDDVKLTAAIPESGYSPNAQAAVEKAAQTKEEPVRIVESAPAEEEFEEVDEVLGAWGAGAAAQKAAEPAAAAKPATTRKRTTRPKPAEEPAAQPAPEAKPAVAGWGTASPTKNEPIKRPAESGAVEASMSDDVDDILAGWDLDGE